MNLLNSLPMATLIMLGGIAVVIVAVVTGDMEVQEALVALGVLGGGAGALGYVRNQAGHGTSYEYEVVDEGPEQP